MRPAPPINSARLAEIPESVRDAGLDFFRQPRQQSGQAGRDPLDITCSGGGRPSREPLLAPRGGPTGGGPERRRLSGACVDSNITSQSWATRRRCAVLKRCHPSEQLLRSSCLRFRPMLGPIC